MSEPVNAGPGVSSRFWPQLILQCRLMLQLNSTQRPWHFPLLASLCTGLPVLLGAYFGHIDKGVLAALGGMVILYMPLTSMAYRMVTLVVCAFGFAVCFTLAALAGGQGLSGALVLGFITVLVNFICRFYQLQSPGRFFFIMIASLASTAKVQWSVVPGELGLLMMGAMLACLLAFGYSLLLPVKHSELASVHQPDRQLAQLWAESVVIGGVVGGSFLLAQSLGLHNPYWVPISCAAIMQGTSVQMLFQRKVHRILGTAVGTVLAWLLFSLTPNAWWLAVAVIVLTFIIESLMVRNYGLAVIFITPLTMVFADMILLGQFPTEQLVLTRMVDIVLGSVCGFVGGGLLHLPLRRWLARSAHRH